MLVEITGLTAGAFRLRDLWLRETRIAGGSWQVAQRRREIVTAGGRVICTLLEGGGIIPGAYPHTRFAGDAGNPEITHAGDAGVRVERLDEHLCRIRQEATLRRMNVSGSEDLRDFTTEQEHRLVVGGIKRKRR
ncbi:hypothetical protein PUG81_28805 [Erwiniaceae bacterium L1_54_6]|jgi:hypothetical protein|nr:hypothetical protein [Erwiniaceae bacterium L1_54_6]